LASIKHKSPRDLSNVTISVWKFPYNFDWSRLINLPLQEKSRSSDFTTSEMPANSKVFK
jgi:hypothetical protein